jgi:hypothetical protein
VLREVILLVIIVFWAYTFIAIEKTGAPENMRRRWLYIVALTGAIGSIVFFIWGRRQLINNS